MSDTDIAAARSSGDDPTLALACRLIERASVTPEDRGCLELIAERLQPLGFTLERIDRGGVSNLWARRGREGPVLAFAGHTDVVPTGPREHWRHDPFTPRIDADMLYGRGAADMKGSLAAMVTACEAFVAARPNTAGSLALLLTSDEEGPATDGTLAVLERLAERGERIDWCVVGEPSSRERLGDMVRVGRRGSLSATLIVRGVQGHVAYPEQVVNPIHLAAPLLAELAATEWDRGNEYFPPTSFQVSNIAAGTGADNVVPGELEARFNFRFCTASSAGTLRERVAAICVRHGLDHELRWSLSGEPFLTGQGPLVEAVREALLAVAGIDPELSTGGGTSDGRFIAPFGAEVVEVGPVNATIHKVDECVRASDLVLLSAVYRRIMERLLPAG